MRGAVLHGARDVRFEERDAPKIIEPTDAILRLSATCICGSDLWPYRGINATAEPTPMGHEYCGIVEEVGRAVKSVKPGQFAIGSFFASDNTCPHCKAGYQNVVQTSAARRRRPSAHAARAAGGRHVGRDTRGALGGSDPELARRL